MPVFSLHFIETFDFLLDYPFASWVNRLSKARSRKKLSFSSPFLYLPSPLPILRLRFLRQAQDRQDKQRRGTGAQKERSANDSTHISDVCPTSQLKNTA